MYYKCCVGFTLTSDLHVYKVMDSYRHNIDLDKD